VIANVNLNMSIQKVLLYNLRGCSEFSLFTSKSRLAISGEVDSLLVTRGGGSGGDSDSGGGGGACSVPDDQRNQRCDGCLVVCL
jgi:hypothetical protein